MKRILILFCGLAMALSLAACGANESRHQPADSPAPPVPSKSESGELANLPAASVPTQTESGEPPAPDRQEQSAADETTEAAPPAKSESGSVHQQDTPDSSFAEPPLPQEPAGEPSRGEHTTMKINVQVGNHAFTATLEQSEAARAFVELMEKAPVVIEMSDYSGFEKVGPLGISLPADDRQITTQPGDVVLYSGNQIVVFYGSNSWSYTMLGRIDDLTGWEEALGNGDVTIAFSMK